MDEKSRSLPGPLRNIHSHGWIMGAAGLIAGLGFLVYAPSIPAVSNSLFLFAGFHIVGALALLGGAYSLGLRRLLSRAFSPQTERSGPSFDFGWGPEWMNGLGLAAIIVIWAAVAMQIAAPGWWPLAFVLLMLGVGLFVGNLIMRSFRSADHVVLPMVDLVRSDNDLILDAGCGAGRTTIALRRVLRNGRIVAVDRFDADYIAGGGRELIAHNVKAAGLAERVRIETADLTKLPFESDSFDGAVSTNVFDHLGASKGRELSEAFRVLKPGGRFLMAVWVPGWPMFAVGNVFSFFLTSRQGWRRLARRAGFTVADEGAFNYAWFVLLEKPAAGV